MGAQKTQAFLEIDYPGQPRYYIDEIKEFSYSSDVTAVGDQCTFKVVADAQGQTLAKLRGGARSQLKLRNPAVNGGNWTVKHSGRIINTDADTEEGVIHVTTADLGWHLMNCHAPLWKRLRNLSLAQILDPKPTRINKKTGKPIPPLIDPSFGFTGLRTGLDANALNRHGKQGRAGFIGKEGSLAIASVILVEPGESFWTLITRYAQRENCLVNVAIDDFLQAWNPDFSREPLFDFSNTPQKKNIGKARCFDDITTRYTVVEVVGEVLDKDAQFVGPGDPTVNKRRGTYTAATDPANGLPAPVPFLHRKTASDGEMYRRDMAKGQAEWMWKQGLWESHYLTVVVPDHFQGSAWLESDNMCTVHIPELNAVGPYYVASVKCDSTVERGDETTLILRWPYLLSASFGVWGSQPKYRSASSRGAMQPGTGTGT